MNYEELLANPFFMNMDYSHVQSLLECSTVLIYKRKRILFLHGEENQCLYIVIDGWIKLYSETFDGQEAILGFATTGDVIGETNFAKRKHFYTAQTINESKLIKIPCQKFKELIETNGRMALKLISVLNSSVNKYRILLEHNTTMKAAQRIGCFILKLSKEKNNKNLCIKLPFDKMLIASYLSMKRETFSRALQELKRIGTKVKGNSVYISEIDQLIHFCCSSCSLINFNFNNIL
jgi:CRP-like cAMP-binding protein